MNKTRLAIAAALIATVPVVAVSTPAFAQLSTCSGTLTSTSYSSVCRSGNGLQRAWVHYWLDTWGPGVTFTRSGVWAGLGQTSVAGIGTDGHIISYGRNYSG